MATVKVCDVCEKKIDGECETISLEDTEVCKEHAELWEFAWSSQENSKAMFDSIRRRKAHQEKG